MSSRNRRDFLADVGRGMLIAGLGSGLAADMGLASEKLADGPERVTFGELEPLVCLMQETPPDKLLPILVEKLNKGTQLKELTAAAALANARAFGGDDYTGFHTAMALAPAHHMASEMPSDRKALPVLKVIHRNSRRIQENKAATTDAIHPVKPATLPKDRPGGELLLEAVRTKDKKKAEETFAALVRGNPEDAFNDLLVAVQDGHDVHRIVLPYRAWALLDIVGSEHAHTMLRQSVRFCVNAEKHNGYYSEARTLLPKLLEKHKLPRESAGKRQVEDSWVDKMCDTLFTSKAADAAQAVASALADGISPEAISEAISLAANQLVLRDVGRLPNQTSAGKPAGSVHGDSIGVHACDSANAWRWMARASNPRNAAACLILSGYQVARDRGERGGDFLNWKPRPWTEHSEKVKAKEPAALLREAEEAIKANDQAQACAVVARCAELKHDTRPVFDLLLRYSVSEDGALHAEKYYRTVVEEYNATRPAFRWRQLIALARVVASEHGTPAPGYAEACRLLKV